MATISALRRALDAPAAYFRRLGGIVPADGRITRTSLFAEARVEWEGIPYLLFMPLAEGSMRRMERFAPLRRHVCSPAVPRIEIFCDEMAYEDSLGRGAVSDIVAERLPDARPLADVLATLSAREEAEALTAAADALENELERVGVSHNNLTEENILIDGDGALYPVRWHYATAGAGGDRKAFDALRTKIAETARYAAERMPAKAAAPYADEWMVYPMAEGLAPVQTPRGWGFVDSRGRTAIEPRYLWANGFREGRAEVETDGGMGLIDKSGRYVIEPRYRIVEYDPPREIRRSASTADGRCSTTRGGRSPISPPRSPNCADPQGRKNAGDTADKAVKATRTRRRHSVGNGA